MRRFVIGTAGHVDHGKTTLVGALTGIQTDRLPEEKRRGITIELGFARWSHGDLDVSIVDVPGHRRLVHTMIAGAVGMELALLVVSADEGVMPQTREHLAACEILGIGRLVVAITKIDRVDRELAELAALEVGELLSGRFQFTTVLVSARTGEGLPELRDTLASALSALPPRDTSVPARLSVDRVFSIKGAGTVVTGTLVQGALSVGAELALVGDRGSVKTAARGLHVHDRSASSVAAPSRVAVNLAGLAVPEVHRGDVLSADWQVAPTRRFDAELRLLSPLKNGAHVEVYVGTARRAGRIQILVAGDEEHPDRVVARIRLLLPMVVVGGDRFVVRSSSIRGTAGAVVGGGKVLDARPPLSKDKRRRQPVFAALREGDIMGLGKALVAERAPRAILSSDVGARFSMPSAALIRAFEKLADRGEIVRLKEDGYLDRDALSRLSQKARTLVARHHEEHPLERGLALSTLRQRLADRVGMAVAIEAIRTAAKKVLSGEPIVVMGDVAKLANFVEGGAEPKGELEKLRVFLSLAGLKGSGEFALREHLGVSAKEIRPILAKMVRDGVLVAAGEQWFSARSVEALRGQILAHFSRSSVLTIADFKEMSGLGRKQAIPLLELFDREGTTIRKGDDRFAGPKVPKS